MKNVSIIADTTCDLSMDLKAEYQVTTFPLHVYLGEREYLDGIDISPDDIFRWSDENNATPKTSSISLEEAKEILQSELEQTEKIIYLCMSGHIASVGKVMQLAAQELKAEDRVLIVDSKSLSTGIALQLAEACEMKNRGLTPEEIVAGIQALQPRVRASFVVDTLTYLYRGGRCSGLAAMAGDALKLHPLITVVDGEMRPEKRYRGKMERVIMDYVSDMEDELKKAKPDRVFITHSGCEDEIIDKVKERLASLKHFKEILITRAGSVVTSHCGPGALGVLFIAGE